MSALIFIKSFGHAQREDWCNVICEDPIVFFCAKPEISRNPSRTFENECELNKYNCLHPQNRKFLRKSKLSLKLVFSVYIYEYFGMCEA